MSLSKISTDNDPLGRGGRSGAYTIAEKKIAAATFVICGNMAEVHRVTGIPEDTLRGWTRKEWWSSLYEEAKAEHTGLLESRLASIVEKATAELLDRMQNGDYILKYNPGTKVVESFRVPLKAKELAQIVDKQTTNLRLLRNEPTSLKVEAKFDYNKMAKQFAQVAEEHRDSIVSEQ